MQQPCCKNMPQVLTNSSKLHQSPPSCTNMQQVAPAYTTLHQHAQSCTNLHHVALNCTKLHLVAPTFTCSVLSSFGVVLMSCRVKFQVVRSALQYSACRINMSIISPLRRRERTVWSPSILKFSLEKNLLITLKLITGRNFPIPDPFFKKKGVEMKYCGQGFTLVIAPSVMRDRIASLIIPVGRPSWTTVGRARH